MHVLYNTLTLFQCDFMELVSLLKATRDPGSLPKSLVFCHTKEVAVKIYKHLIQFSRSKEYVSLFHASLTQATKVHIVAQFRLAHSSLRILVATIAFGMVCAGMIVYFHFHYKKCLSW